MKKIKIYIASPIDRSASAPISSLCSQYVTAFDPIPEVVFWSDSKEFIGWPIKRSLGCKVPTGSNTSRCGEYRLHG